jgi:malonyl-CoA decarboxylase
VVERTRALCGLLLSERGEASGVALARNLITLYEAMDRASREAFFDRLARDFDPNPAAIARAAQKYQESPTPEAFLALSATVEAPRQELFRRINFAPGGTRTLVAMRGHLLEFLRSRPHLSSVEFDLKHLLGSWFNRGFLRLERIDWHTSAEVLEKLIQYEAVHEINGWPDLRRRLAKDRRCFGFFHPALPDEPLIFVEVALVRGQVAALEPLLDLNAPVTDPVTANTAVFYSINNCLKGLRGISFGSFLIKQVTEELRLEWAEIKRYITLSPLPDFARALREDGVNMGSTHFPRERLAWLLRDYAGALTRRAGCDDAVEALGRLLERPLDHRRVLAAPLSRLALVYLTQLKHDGTALDPVAQFHLANGARLERINPFANLRPYGLSRSFGVMANYRYLPGELEHNHERFLCGGEIAMAPKLKRDYEEMAAPEHGRVVIAAHPEAK